LSRVDDLDKEVNSRLEETSKCKGLLLEKVSTLPQNDANYSLSCRTMI